MVQPKAFWEMLKETFTRWQEDRAPTLAAALAYYTIFSIAPLLLIAIVIAGVVFGEAAVRGQIVEQVSGLVGPEAATIIEDAVENASKPAASIPATIIGVVMLLLGASGIFGQLRGALNTIWKTDPKAKRGIMTMVREQLASFMMVAGIGALLLISLMASAVLNAVGDYLSAMLPFVGTIMPLIDFLVSFSIITVLFAAIYRILPDTKIAWSDVWPGAIFTAFLFVIGKLLIGIYLGKVSVGSPYGAAGGLIVALVWVYYSAQLFLFGAEFTRLYADKYGSRSTPEKRAELAKAEGKPVEPPPDEGPDTSGVRTVAIHRLVEMAKAPLLAVTMSSALALALFGHRHHTATEAVPTADFREPQENERLAA